MATPQRKAAAAQPMVFHPQGTPAAPALEQSLYEIRRKLYPRAVSGWFARWRLALVIATPLAYYFMQQWLSDFAYHVSLEWRMFVLAGLIAMSIALFTVSFQSIKAALANPVDSLRSE